MGVLVTGGANGIGKATVQRLLEKGHEVTVIDCDKDALETLPEEVKKHSADVRYEEASQIVEGKNVDILVNCAGFQQQGSVEDMELEVFREHIETNYLGTVRMVKEALPALRKNEGKIINVSSLAGRMTIPFLGAYSASKYAVEGFTDALRMEMHDSEVEVVLVEPGPVRTGFNREAIEALRQYIPGSRYSEQYEERLKGSSFEGISPQEAAETVIKAVESDNPKARYRITWQAHLGPRLKTVLPTRIYDRLARKF